MLLFTKFYSEAEILAGAWRYPFILGLPVLVITLFLRKNLLIDPLAKNDNTIAKPQLIRSNFKKMMTGFILVSALQTAFYILFIWYADYLSLYLGVSRSISTYCRFISLLMLLTVVLSVSLLLDKLDSFKLIKLILIGIVVIVPAVFHVVEQSPLLLVILAGIFIISVPVGFFIAIILSTLNELFDPCFRGTGVSCSFTLASVFVGGFSPVLAMKLIESTGNIQSPSYLIISVCLIALMAISVSQHK